MEINMTHLLNNLSLRAKIMGSTAIPLILMVLIGLYSIYSMDRIVDGAGLITGMDNPPVGKLAKLKEYQRTSILMIGFGFLISVLIGGFLSWVVSSSIVNRIVAISRSFKSMVSGNLAENPQPDGADEIGRMREGSLAVRDKFQNLLLQIERSTEHVAAVAEQTSVVSQRIRTNIQQQQADMEQLGSGIETMTAMAGEIAANIETTVQATERADKETSSSQSAVETSIAAIDQLAVRVGGGADAVETLENNSESIGSVVDVIGSIAEQTNLLALNAAIEAARAGEQGRGFAVVADEVRTLAGRTQESTAKIKQMIETLQSGARTAAEAMKNSREQIQSVVKLVAQVRMPLESVAGDVIKINEMNTYIGDAARQQAGMVEEINQNIFQNADKTQETTEDAEQAVVAGEELASIASELRDLIGQFKASVG